MTSGSFQVDLFVSFRSPYSYLAAPRVVAIEARFAVEFRVRPVYPLAVRDPGLLLRANPLAGAYLLRDVMRSAEYLEMAFRWPEPDPVVQNMQTLEVASHQPHIHRLTRLGVCASEKGRGLAFFKEVSQLLWGGALSGWDQGGHLAQAAQRVGLDLVAMEREIEAATEDYEQLIQQNQLDLHTAGHWGVPTFVFEGEPFFGQDRIALLLWRLQRRGLAERVKLS